jgi:hypothetical protein
MDAIFLDEIKNYSNYHPESKGEMTKITDLVKILHLKIGSKTTLREVNSMCSDIIHS